MPRPKGKVPSYCLHKRSGRAVVRLNRKDHYLGKYGSEESQEEYQRLIQVWLATNKAHAAKRAERFRLKDPAIKIETITLLYREFAAGYYVKNRKPTKEYVEMGLALRPVRARVKPATRLRVRSGHSIRRKSCNFFVKRPHSWARGIRKKSYVIWGGRNNPQLRGRNQPAN